MVDYITSLLFLAFLISKVISRQQLNSSEKYIVVWFAVCFFERSTLKISSNKMMIIFKFCFVTMLGFSSTYDKRTFACQFHFVREHMCRAMNKWVNKWRRKRFTNTRFSFDSEIRKQLNTKMYRDDVPICNLNWGVRQIDTYAQYMWSLFILSHASAFEQPTEFLLFFYIYLHFWMRDRLTSFANKIWYRNRICTRNHFERRLDRLMNMKRIRSRRCVNWIALRINEKINDDVVNE